MQGVSGSCLADTKGSAFQISEKPVVEGTLGLSYLPPAPADLHPDQSFLPGTWTKEKERLTVTVCLDL